MQKGAYYNEIDPYAAQWLRNLIAARHIAAGDVDDRSIVEIKADDLKGYTQAHFFAGIGGWSVALRLAGWPDERPVWTGSCPCQPFSAAGAGKAADDERHLWPAWFPLVAQRRPPIVFGEQVEAAIGWGWIEAVFSDLEGEGYACGATVLPACGIGAPHYRARAWFLADATQSNQRRHAGKSRGEAGACGGEARTTNGHSARGSSCVGNTNGAGRSLGIWDARDDGTASGPVGGEASQQTSYWSDCDWLDCIDGTARAVEPGSFPLAHGVQRRTSKLRAYGNAIVPQVAAEFVKAYIETRP